jgi:hypothetical protein
MMEGDRCPKCGMTTLPTMQVGSLCTARACTNPTCGFIEEFRKKEEVDDTKRTKG